MGRHSDVIALLESVERSSANGAAQQIQRLRGGGGEGGHDSQKAQGSHDGQGGWGGGGGGGGKRQCGGNIPAPPATYGGNAAAPAAPAMGAHNAQAGARGRHRPGRPTVLCVGISVLDYSVSLDSFPTEDSKQVMILLRFLLRLLRIRACS